jgi:hypothetical protein
MSVRALCVSPVYCVIRKKKKKKTTCGLSCVHKVNRKGLQVFLKGDKKKKLL